MGYSENGGLLLEVIEGGYQLPVDEGPCLNKKQKGAMSLHYTSWLRTTSQGSPSYLCSQRHASEKIYNSARMTHMPGPIWEIYEYRWLISNLNQQKKKK